MDRELEVIRDQMEETRASLADKLEALETQVRETVSSASETVTSAVDGVKNVVETVTDKVGSAVDNVSEKVESVVDNVSDKVESAASSVAEAFNVKRHVEEHPWASLGVAVAAGFAAGYLLGPSREGTNGRASYAERLGPSPVPTPSTQPAHTSSWTDTASEAASSVENVLGEVWKTAGGTITSLAVGTLMSVVKDLVSKNVPPEWKNDLVRTVDDITTKLGGKPMDPSDSLLSMFGMGHQGTTGGQRPAM